MYLTSLSRESGVPSCGVEHNYSQGRCLGGGVCVCVSTILHNIKIRCVVVETVCVDGLDGVFLWVYCCVCMCVCECVWTLGKSILRSLFSFRGTRESMCVCVLVCVCFVCNIFSLCGSFFSKKGCRQPFLLLSWRLYLRY